MKGDHLQKSKPLEDYREYNYNKIHKEMPMLDRIVMENKIFAVMLPNL